MARVFCVGGAINHQGNHTGSEFLSDAPFFGLSLWTEFKLANCTCASGWSCLMNLDTFLLVLHAYPIYSVVLVN